MEFSRPEYWSGQPFPSPGDLPNPGIKPRCLALQVDSLSAEPQGKPRNTGVGSLSLLQWIFPTQESNQDLLHCRRILYQLSYQGSQNMLIQSLNFRTLLTSLLTKGLRYKQSDASRCSHSHFHLHILKIQNTLIYMYTQTCFHPP